MNKLALSAVLVASIFAGNLVAAETTHSNPKRQNQYGYSKSIFVSATSGSQFCKEIKGGNSRMVDAEMKCGEDESSYVEYNWTLKDWVSKSTGSKNQCYPLFEKITCN